jgi:myosin heavy subunit
MDKTVKIRAYPDDAKGAPQGNQKEDQGKVLELARKNAQLEEKSLDQLRIIEQLKESLRQEQAKAAELAKKTAGADVSVLALKEAQLEEEKSRGVENLKTIVQLRESLKLEQGKTAEMVKIISELEARAKESASAEASELVKRTAELEEEKRKLLEQAQTIEQLRESLKQEQAKSAGMADKLSELEAGAREVAALEAKVNELTDAMSKIVAIAAAGKAV